MRNFLLMMTLAAVPASAAPRGAGSPRKTGSVSSLLKRVSTYLNAPAVKKSPRRAAVAAIRSGIPTDQGENLDSLLLDGARPLREALKRPDAEGGDEAALRPIYEALAASQFVQALSVVGAPAGREEAAAALEAWAKEPSQPSLPAGVRALLTGPAARIDDKALVAAGWGGHARSLVASGAKGRTAAAGWSSSADAARLDETLKGLSDSWLERKLEAEAEAKAHLLAGQVYAALAKADLRGRAPEAARHAAPAARLDDDYSPAPAEAAVPFEPKSIYQKASKSVVLILCASSDGSGELGTGSLVDASRRRILTNAHVVISDSTRRPWGRVSVYFKPAKMTGDPKRDLVDAVEGKVIAWDRGLDLALIEASRLPEGTPAIALGHPDAVSVGDRVAAIGHPEQGGLWTLTTGVISTLQADLGGVKGKDAFQTDASINRGNSGGPLLDASGRLVGVNTSMSRKAADGLAITSVNFAVRSDVARRWMAGQGEKLAYGRAAAPEASAAQLAKIPDPVPAPVMAAAPAAREGPAAARAARTPKPLMIAEGKPYDRDSVIEAEIAKMEELGDEMHNEIRRKTGR